MSQARPFIKWAGGKTQLLPQLLDIFPGKIGTYYEPFLGGGAVFFALAHQKRFHRAMLNDWNRELIDAYRAVRDFPEDLVGQLSALVYSRETFDELRLKTPDDLGPVRRAVRLIYLNKTGFNGLYRVNRKGQFNTPFGKFKTPPRIVDAENIRLCSEVLNRYASLYSTDFSEVVKDAGPEDVVYFDPPYVPLNATANFASYTSDGFGIDDQHRVAACFKELVERGVKVVASNSDTEVVRALYSGFEIHEVRARRSINSKGDSRGPINELIIVGRRSSSTAVATYEIVESPEDDAEDNGEGVPAFVKAEEETPETPAEVTKEAEAPIPRKGRRKGRKSDPHPPEPEAPGATQHEPPGGS